LSQLKVKLIGESVEGHKAYVVAGLLIAFAWVTEAYDEGALHKFKAPHGQGGSSSEAQAQG
jgi:hypothetical protein